jgi:hypothetical protein
MSINAVIGSGSFDPYIISAIRLLIEHMVGCSLVSGLINYLFRSLPDSDVL